MDFPRKRWETFFTQLLGNTFMIPPYKRCLQTLHHENALCHHKTTNKKLWSLNLPFAALIAWTNSRCFSFHLLLFGSAGVTFNDSCGCFFRYDFWWNGARSVPSTLCFNESKTFLFLAAFFSQTFRCFCRGWAAKVRPHTSHGNNSTGTTTAENKIIK